MPVISTLGALTTFKGTENALYWVVTFDAISALVFPVLSTFVESNNSTSLSGRITPTTADQPQYIKISTGSGVLPTILYSAFYGSNANTEGDIAKTLFDSVNNRTILVGTQEANVSGFVRNCGMIRILDSNNSTTNAFLDPPVTPSPANASQGRGFSSAVLNANSSITVAGTMSRDPVFPSYFITNYSQTGTRNWSKQVTGTVSGPAVHNIVSSNILVSVKETISNTAFGYLLPNGSSFTSTFGIQDFDLNGEIAIDASNNLYVCGDNKLIKYDAAGNSIGWVKDAPINNFLDATFYDGNIYATIASGPSPENPSTTIVSINANTGSVNWQNELSIQGSNTGIDLRYINANIQGLFALGVYSENISLNLTTGSILLKLPTNGYIPGSGSYEIGAYGLFLDIDPGSVLITNGTANLISSNIGLANANVVSTTTLSISANTTQNYIFNDTILK